MTALLIIYWREYDIFLFQFHKSSVIEYIKPVKRAMVAVIETLTTEQAVDAFVQGTISLKKPVVDANRTKVN